MKDELTEVDIRKMQSEIEHRRHVVAPHLRDLVKAAKEQGDLSENDGYHSARREFNANNSRIAYLEAMIKSAVILIPQSKLQRNPDGTYDADSEIKRILGELGLDAGQEVRIVADSADKIGLFDKVGVHYVEDDEDDVFTIVTTLRNDVRHHCISKESPLGSALLGHMIGDTVKITVNDSISYKVTVTSIEKGEDDANLEIAKY